MIFFLIFLHGASTPDFIGVNASLPVLARFQSRARHRLLCYTVGNLGQNERTDNMAVTLGHAIGVAISLVLLVAIAAAAHYLQQIRDTLREMQKTQKALATRLGAKV